MAKTCPPGQHLENGKCVPNKTSTVVDPLPVETVDPLPVLPVETVKPGAAPKETRPTLDVTDPYEAFKAWFIQRYPGTAGLDEVSLRARIQSMFDITTPRALHAAATNVAGWQGGQQLGQLSPEEYVMWKLTQPAGYSGGWGYTPEQARIWMEQNKASWATEGKAVPDRMLLSMAKQGGWKPVQPPAPKFDPVKLEEYLAAHPGLDPAVVQGLRYFLSGDAFSDTSPQVGKMLDALGIPRDSLPQGARHWLMYGDGGDYLAYALANGYDPVEALRESLVKSTGYGAPDFGTQPPGAGNTGEGIPPSYTAWRDQTTPNSSGEVLNSAWDAYNAGQLTWSDYSAIRKAFAAGVNISVVGKNQVGEASPTGGWLHFDREGFDNYVGRKLGLGAAWEQALVDANDGQNVYRYAGLVDYSPAMNVFVPAGFEFGPEGFTTPMTKPIRPAQEED